MSNKIARRIQALTLWKYKLTWCVSCSWFRGQQIWGWANRWFHFVCLYWYILFVFSCFIHQWAHVNIILWCKEQKIYIFQTMVRILWFKGKKCFILADICCSRICWQNNMSLNVANHKSYSNYSGGFSTWSNQCFISMTSSLLSQLQCVQIYAHNSYFICDL